MDKLIVRSATIKDCEKIAELEKECFSDPWSYDSIYSEVVNNLSAYWLVGEYIVDGEIDEIIGYIGFHKVLDEGHVMNIAVTKDYRGLGFGRHLMDAMIKLAEELDITNITLEVRESNYIAQALYESFGFQKAGVRKGYYLDNKEDAIIMWRMKEKDLN